MDGQTESDQGNVDNRLVTTQSDLSSAATSASKTINPVDND